MPSLCLMPRTGAPSSYGVFLKVNLRQHPLNFLSAGGGGVQPEQGYIVENLSDGEPAICIEVLWQIAQYRPHGTGLSAGLTPPTYTSPDNGCNRVARIRMSVVFPAPLGPTAEHAALMFRFLCLRRRTFTILLG